MSYTANYIDWPLVLDWIEALESGDYEQCVRLWRYNNTYCASGVALDLCNPDAWESFGGGGSYYWTPRSRPVRDDLGLSKAQWRTVQRLNDDGHSFAEIATVLRSWYGLVD